MPIEPGSFCFRSSGRIVAYPDRTAFFFGDYFRIAGDSPGTLPFQLEGRNPLASVALT